MAVHASPRGAALTLVSLTGLGLVLVAWSEARDTAVVEDQMSWAALGLAGASVVGLAALCGLTLARHDVRRRLHAVSAVLEHHLPEVTVPHPEPVAVADSDRVTAPRMRHYHRRGCVLVTGKDTHHVVPVERDGLAPCTVCEA